MGPISSEVVASLTGRKQAKLQIRWLAENGWIFVVGGDGLPKVDEEYYRERMGVKLVEKKRKGPRLEGLNGTAAHHNA